MNKKLTNVFFVALMSIAAFGFVSCSDDDEKDGNKGTGNETGKAYFHVVLGLGEGGNDGTLSQAIADLSKGSITFDGYGFVVPSVRTARVYASSDGNVLYNLNYGGGTVAKYTANGGQSYSRLSELNVKYAIGTTNPRWTKVDDDYALMHHITTENKYKDVAGTEYDYTAATAYLVSIGLAGNMSMGAVEQFEVPRSEEDIENNLNVWRIDAPAVYNGKAYYGLAKRQYDAATNSNVNVDYSATSIVVDYPSLTNPKVISSKVAKGSTYGYRTPVAHVDEKGDIYQIAGSPAYILKIRNEAYDDSFVFSLSEKLGLDIEVASNGWFYVGNGIGYVPFYDISKGSGAAAAAWSVARVDLNNETAIKMNVPGSLWLQQYQYSVTGNDGLFYMALSPVGEDGHIYMFDPASISPDGFTKGAAIHAGAEQFYIGIF